MPDYKYLESIPLISKAKWISDNDEPYDWTFNPPHILEYNCTEMLSLAISYLLVIVGILFFPIAFIILFFVAPLVPADDPSGGVEWLPYAILSIIFIAFLFVGVKSAYLAHKHKDDKIWIDISDDSLVFEKGKTRTGKGMKFSRDPQKTKIKQTKTSAQINRRPAFSFEITDGKQNFTLESKYPEISCPELNKMLKMLISTGNKDEEK